MPLRDLQCIMEAGEETSWPALAQTRAFAHAYAAEPSILVFGAEVRPPKSFINQGWVSGLISSENAKQKERVELAAAKARQLLQGHKAADVSVRLGAIGELLSGVRLRSRCFDLTILDRPESAMGHAELVFEEVLFGSGGPLLVASPDKAPAERIESMLVAWDGSIHATRALASALGLFPEAKRAEVVVVTGEKNLEEEEPGAGIAAHLRRHGLKAEVHQIAMAEDGVGATLDAEATRLGVDLLVMGGFGRSRFRELVLGGVTRDVSRSASTPVLFDH